jgi:hypothetical protein
LLQRPQGCGAPEGAIALGLAGGYRIPMSSPAAGDDDLVGYAQTADIRQAEYYLRLLSHQRECVEMELAAERRVLAARSAPRDFNQIRRLQRAVRRQETDLHVLDRLIDALNDRLTASR